MLENLIFLVGGLVYGVIHFYMTSRVTKSILASDVLRAGLFLLGKFLLYAVLVVFFLLYTETGRIWALAGYGAGICVPAFTYAIVTIVRKGDESGGKSRNN